MMYRFYMVYRFFVTILVCSISQHIFCQEVLDTSTSAKISEKYFDAVSKKANTLQQNLDKKSQKVLDRMQKEEVKLQKKLSKIDSLATHNIFSNSAEKYNQFKEKLKSTEKLSQYIPKLDTLATSLKFLDQHPEFLDNVTNAKEKLALASEKLNEFKDKLKNAEDIKQFLKERKQYLKEQLEKFGFGKELKKINKEVYYYAEQIKEYKEIFNDPKKIEKKAIELLSKTKLFQDFMKKNSLIASLFAFPSTDPNNLSFLTAGVGLQTRAQVTNFIQTQSPLGAFNTQQVIQQNIQQAQSQLQELKNKLNAFGNSSDDIMPEGFKPNDQKKKSFLKRLELGINLQTQGAKYMFPVTTDLGLSLGYKLNDKSVIGIGAAYKIGWGTGWNNIKISHQGVGFRTYIDWKLKGSFWLSGGYEQNFKAEIKSIDQLKDVSAWQQSGLIGLSKIVSIRSKAFKKTKVQLLWDLLSYQQRPTSHPLIFRIGYSF